MNKYVYGVDVGGTNIKIGLFQIKPFKKISDKEVKTPTGDDSNLIFDKIVETIELLNEESKVDYNDVSGIGVAVPCPIVCGDVSLCPNIGIKNTNINNEIKKRIPKHILVESGNDANMAALGEFNSFKENYKNAVFYTLGTGVGGGIVVNGKIIEGRRGAAGELGHMRIDEGTDELCGCGLPGCLEVYAGTKGMLNAARRYATYETSLVEKSNLTIKDIFDFAKMGDKVANKVVDDAMEALAISAANVALTVDPDIFIIGGGVANAGDFLIDRLKKFYKLHARFDTDKIDFVLARLKNTAGSFGSAYYVIDKINESNK